MRLFFTNDAQTHARILAANAHPSVKSPQKTESCMQKRMQTPF